MHPSITQERLSPMVDLLCTILVLCRGSSGGKPSWAYMAIRPSNARAFKEACDRGNIDLDDYGTVIESGEGKEPPQEVKDRMRDRFGMRDDFEELLQAAIEAQKNRV